MGKTLLAAAAINSGPCGSLFVGSIELLDDVRASYAGGGHGLLERALDAPLLAIDDLGSESPTDWVRDRFHWLLEQGAWNTCLPLIVTTNCSPQLIAERIGPAAASRIRGLCTHCIEVVGPDMRFRQPRIADRRHDRQGASEDTP